MLFSLIFHLQSIFCYNRFSEGKSFNDKVLPLMNTILSELLQIKRLQYFDDIQTKTSRIYVIN